MLVPLDNLRSAFEDIQSRYRQNAGSCVYLFVSSEVDSLCACRILTQLFRTNHIQYKVMPVTGYLDLQSASAQLLAAGDDEVRLLMMINCGGIVDLVDFFGLHDRENILVYVIDSHRPYNLGNVRPDNEKIFLLHDSDAKDEEYPSDLEDDDEGSSESDEEMTDAENGGGHASDTSERKHGRDEDVDRPPRRRRLNKASSVDVESRERKRLIVKQYYKYSSYGTSASLVAYTIAAQMSMDNNGVLWLAIVGLTDQYVHDRCDHPRYALHVSFLQSELGRLEEPVGNRRAAAAEAAKLLEKENAAAGAHDMDLDGADADGVVKARARLSTGGSVGMEEPEQDSLVKTAAYGRIFFSEEYRVMLLRHWTLYDSLYHSPYVATRLGVWKEHGKKKLNLFLAKMAVALDECQQAYSFMSVRTKKLLRERLEAEAGALGLSQMLHSSFTMQHETNFQVCASDVVYGLAALLEYPYAHLGSTQFASTEAQLSAPVQGADHSDVLNSLWERNFWLAYDALSPKNTALLRGGIEYAIKLQQAVVRQGTSLYKKKEIHSSGMFRYVLINDSPDLEVFTQPLALTKLVLFLSESYRAEANAKRLPKPFVVAALNKLRGTYLVVGLAENAGMGEINKNSFGVAFRECAEMVNARIKHDGFETSMMEIQKDDMIRFMEVLHSGLVDI